MKNILVCGAGGIGEAVVVLMTKKYQGNCKIVVSDGSKKTLDHLKDMLVTTTMADHVEFKETDFNFSLDSITSKYDFIFDCLPGVFAPKVAKLAVDTGSNYINLTEYVDETNKIMQIGQGSSSSLVLQSGVAPGFVNLLGLKLMKEVESKYENFSFNTMEMKVGALSLHASAPHYYAFTWSPIGVATEYLKPAVALVNGEVKEEHSLAEIKELVISGIRYENAFTSGGVADLAESLKGKFSNVNYQTMRYPGHFAWMKEVIKEEKLDTPDDLLAYMSKTIPHVEDDFVLVYASVEGHDVGGKYIKHERALRVNAQDVNGIKLKAIQISTAIPMIVTAINVFESGKKGVILQSQLDCASILSNELVTEYFVAG